MNNNFDVTIHGLGYVGLTLGIVLGEEGYKVLGNDIDEEKINMLKNKKSYLLEPQINSKISKLIKNKKLNFFSKKHDKKDLSCGVHVICVGTPINLKTKKPILTPILKILETIKKIIKKNDLIIVRSTVPVGFCRDFIIKNLEKSSDIKAGKDFNICFAPERTVEGNAIYELRNNPQIIGGYTNECLNKGKTFFKFCKHILETPNLETAEMAKLVDNTFRDTIFAYANEIAMSCEEKNISAISVIEACNLFYPRNNIPKPSPGVGGPCLSKDPYILGSSFKKNSYKPDLVLSNRETNKKIINRIAGQLLDNIKKKKNPKILFCGIAFKGIPETNDFRNSTILDIINILKKKNKRLKIFGFDPAISIEEFKDIPVKKVNLPSNKKEKYDVIFFGNNNNKFAKIDIQKLIDENITPDGMLYDSWNIFNLNQEVINNENNVLIKGVGF